MTMALHRWFPPAPMRRNGVRRSVVLPKASQRQLAVRTFVTERKELPRTIELVGGRDDSNAGGKVQPTVAGRVAPGPKGPPSLGEAVGAAKCWRKCVVDRHD